MCLVPYDTPTKEDPVRMETDNKTADGIANRTCRVKRLKAIAMRYHWTGGRVSCGGNNILAGFFTESHPAWRHKGFAARLAMPPLLFTD